jgi:hypothetical protein
MQFKHQLLALMSITQVVIGQEPAKLVARNDACGFDGKFYLFSESFQFQLSGLLTFTLLSAW